MKKCLIFCLFLFTLSSQAQFNQQWINRFCCFDSIATHSFSYPIGIIKPLDSLIIAFYEDDSLKLKVVDNLLGTDQANFFYSPDSIQPAFNFGGDFVLCHNGYVYECTNYVNGNYELVFNKVSDEFVQDSLGRVPAGMNKPTKFLPARDTSFLISFLSDSLRFLDVRVNSKTIRQFAYDKTDDYDVYPEMYLNSTNHAIIVTRTQINATDFAIRLKEIDIPSGSILQSATIPATAGNSHRCFKKNDSLFVAFNNDVTGDISFDAIDLNTFNFSSVTQTGVQDFYPVRNFNMNNDSDVYFIETFEKLIRVNADHSIGFIRNLTSPSLSAYNQSPILFDVSNNPILFRSYINNSIVNEDILAIRFDRTTGATIDSFAYNDIRNTPDIAITQFIDGSRHLVLVFANDIDDLFFLQEETQLNLIRMDFLTNGLSQSVDQENILYPNPTSNKLYFKNIADRVKAVEIFDLAGKVLMSMNPMQENSLDLSFLTDGIYFVRIVSEKNILIRKVVKTK